MSNQAKPSWYNEVVAIVNQSLHEDQEVIDCHSDPIDTSSIEEDPEFHMSYITFAIEEQRRASFCMFSGKSIISSTDSFTELHAVLKKYQLDMAFAFKNGQLLCHLTNDIETSQETLYGM